MSIRVYMSQFLTAVGTPREVGQKIWNAWSTLVTTFNRKERRARLNHLKEQGLLEAIPTEWQIWNASHDMLWNYIIPSNGEFYEHYEWEQHTSLHFIFFNMRFSKLSFFTIWSTTKSSILLYYKI